MYNKILKKDVVIIGGGPAGLSAAIRLFENGVRDILIFERENQAGGILRQCIHEGFGLTKFKKSMSGPEYSSCLFEKILEYKIEIVCSTTVINLTADRTVTAVNRDGLIKVRASAVILAMGCRERTRGALSIPGSRPAGIYNAGVAQSYINLHNIMVGKEIVILGSGDIGMIMARRLSLEGAKVLGVYEIQPYASGLPRNVEQCLNDYDIPLFLSHTVVDIEGRDRVSSVTVAKCDELLRPIPGTEKKILCDTLILSVGLIPENELSLAAGVNLDPRTKGAYVDENFQTNIQGVFSVGNVLHVHDLVDFVSVEAEKAAESVAEYLKIGLKECHLSVVCDGNIGHIIPQKISGTKNLTIWYRVREPLQKKKLIIEQGENILLSKTLATAIPAEMEHIDISKSVLDAQKDLTVRII